MKFNFKIQQYQTDAVDSIVKVFAGQPYQEPGSYRRDIGNAREVIENSQMSLVADEDANEAIGYTDDFDESGFDTAVREMRYYTQARHSVFSDYARKLQHEKSRQARNDNTQKLRKRNRESER